MAYLVIKNDDTSVVLRKTGIYIKDGRAFFRFTEQQKKELNEIPAESVFMKEETAAKIVDILVDYNGSRMLTNAVEDKEVLRAVRNSVVMHYENIFDELYNSETNPKDAGDALTRESMVTHVIDMAMYQQQDLVNICRKFL